jgi:cyclohexa-1,5-dienecarbonyl-CoA hydratase
MGLINTVVPQDALEASTAEFLKPYLTLSAEVLRVTTKAVMEGLRDPLDPSLKTIEDIYLDELMRTHDANEGLKAFLEKRKPEWRNE